jgi:hypothetical protein
MEKNQIKVLYCKRGIANFFETYIEINNKLKYNKPLRDYIVKHELGHKKEFDISHEFKINWKMIPSLMWFVLTTPSTWLDFFPIQYKDKQIIYDLNLLILYGLTITSTIILILII